MLKTCRICHEEKPLGEFHPRQEAKDRLKYYCKVCAKQYQKRHNLKKSFGITLEDYAEMLTKQRGVCAICGRPSLKKALAVDHDHKTGRIRGLLCEACNRGIGCLGDCSERLRLAAAYLDAASSKNTEQE